MLSYQVHEYYEYVNKKLSEFKPNLDLIIEFGNKYNDITTNILKKVLSTKVTLKDSTGTHYVIKEGGIQELFKNVIKAFKSEFDFFDVFNAYAILKNDINNYSNNIKINNNSIIYFFENVDNFFKLYQKFMKSDNDIHLALDFGQAVKEISSAYLTIVKTYMEFENNMYDDYEKYSIDNNYGKGIKIQLLDINYTLDEFSEKLSIINDIYNEIGLIIYKNENFNKLQIKKIESGSLLSWIFGDENIVELILTLCNKSINLVFNKFTYEGKMIRHQEFKKELLEDVDITEKMKKLGYDVSEAEDNNKEALTILTKKLLELSKSSPRIKIDDKEYNVKESMKQKFIDDFSKQLLTDGNKKEG